MSPSDDGTDLVHRGVGEYAVAQHAHAGTITRLVQTHYRLADQGEAKEILKWLRLATMLKEQGVL